jgi:hypothetical protein
MTSRAERRRRQRNRPSAPRAIGANDNIAGANDNELIIIGGVTLTARLSGVFRQAELDLASADLARKREGVQALVEIGQAVEAEHDAKHMTAVWDEIRALENGRGGRLAVERVRDQRGKEGERYVVDRDGLSTLASAGGLGDEAQTKRLMGAALRYRADHERIDPEKRLTPPTLLRESKGHGGGDGYADKIAESWSRVRTIHLMIAGVEPSLDPKARPAMPSLPAGHPVMQAIYVLEEVAGKGSNLRELSKSGSVQRRLSKALILALGVCAIVYGLD